jgi:hypothetical protein
MRNALALQISECLKRAIGAHQREYAIAFKRIRIALDGKGHSTRQIYGKGCRPRGKARDMQPARAHGFNLRRIAGDLEINHTPPDALAKIFQQRPELRGVKRWVFHRRIGKNQRGGVTLPRRIGRHIGHHIAIGIAIGLIQGTAERACGLRYSITGK